MKELPLITPVSSSCCSTEATSDACCAPALESATDSTSEVRGEVDGLRVVLAIDGMDCASCAITLERSVRQVDGVHRAVVNFAAARLDVVHDEAATTHDIERAVQRAGFRVADPDHGAGSSYWRTSRARLTASAGVLYLMGLIALLAPVPEAATIAVFASCIALAGLPVFRSAWVALRARHLDMNVLMSAATVGATIIGEWAEAASVVVLFSIGNALQAYAVDRTRNAVRALVKLTPLEVTVLRDGIETLMEAGEVQVDDHFVVRPGERIALDGRIVEGSSSLNEAPVTGESMVVEKSIGDRVLSGTLNTDGALVVRAERLAADSTLQHIIRLVEQAQATKAPTEQLVDRFSRIYTPIVVLASLALIIVPVLLGGDPSTWVYRGLALLIIACPCSLVISTPVTVVSAIGAASRRGVLIKGGEALEAMGRMHVLAFDKTGTLTEGRPVVTSVHVVGDVTRERALVLAGSVERRSQHPLAHAILTAAEGLDLLEPTQFMSIPGRGAAAQIDGQQVYVGSPRLLHEHSIATDTITSQLDAIHEAGETPVVLATTGGPLAAFGISDAIRHDARDALDELRRAGISRMLMITGDSEQAAKRVADELGLEHRAELLPQDKLEIIRELHARHGIVGMVGDGVNDAPALAAASVSFAMGAAGSDAALEAADVALMSDDLHHIGRAVRLSRAAERIIRQNVVWSLLIKGAFVLFAPFGLVTLWAAVLADMGTSLAVTANGLRLFRHDR